MSMFSRKTLTAATAALTLGASVMAFANPASAGHWRHRHHGGAVAAGVIGGLALGALAASAARPGYAAPVHGAYGPVYGPECYTVRRRVVDGWGNVYLRRVRYCD